MIYFTSDTHFSHQQQFLYAPRGFETIEQHDKQIIENWNSIVKPEDTVYHLGDLMLNDKDNGMNCLRQLNGNIKVIFGNHDTINKIELYKTIPNITLLGYADMIKYGKCGFYLSHYPTVVGGEYNMNDKLFCLCGHSHTQDKFQDIGIKSYHVELDAHNNYPVSIDKILEDIRGYINK